MSAMPALQHNLAAAYLIVGGLRGLCGSLAVHLARHGARLIISINRTGIYDAASARVCANCAAYGCEIVEGRRDVGDLDFVRQVFRSVQPRRVANLIQDAMVLQVAGTSNLHFAAQTKQPQALDFFTMPSGMSGIVGNKGQTKYAAGNAFLDAFAGYRNSTSLRANTINLGMVEDEGYVAEQGGTLEAHFDRRYWVHINEVTLRRILSYSIFQQQAIRRRLNSAQLTTSLVYPLNANSSAYLKAEPRLGLFLNSHGIGGGGDKQR
ncbi:unnamed protein product [Penicillium viridicatum]